MLRFASLLTAAIALGASYNIKAQTARARDTANVDLSARFAP